METLTQEIILNPAGHLIAPQEQSAEISSTWFKNVLKSFTASQESGLLSLVATKSEGPLSPSISFWRDFAHRYFTDFCRRPPSEDKTLAPLPFLSEAEISTLLLSVPPMPGGEYLTVEILQNIWTSLDDWFRETLTSSGKSVEEWFKDHAPLWHQVGRICFHLTENKNNPEHYPFLFMPTYSPRLSKGGRIQYQPLNKALKEYAGEGNKKALLHLLSPVSRAAEKSKFVKELLDTKEIFQAQSWTPQETYRFLKEISLYEESGILVRLPDWWHKRSNPHVAITIGSKKQNRLNSDALLDFKVELALNEKNLTDAEWKELMKAEDGLVYLKGQWIEVNREKLKDVLTQWKEIKRNSFSNGISFIEGMRLLAGIPADLNPKDDFDEEDRRWFSICAGPWLSEILAGLRDPTRLEVVHQNKNFCGTLRPYQKVGHQWLWFLSNLGIGACLADDMGLGKTIQVISLFLSLKESSSSKPSLLVLPASLLSNWKSEIKRFAPTLQIRFVHPAELSKNDLASLSKNPTNAFSGIDVVLTTYGMLLR
ncbi:MAG: SNF2 helicase-associated domain-containing protein, partial [Planctomycetota bacterium]